MDARPQGRDKFPKHRPNTSIDACRYTWFLMEGEYVSKRHGDEPHAAIPTCGVEHTVKHGIANRAR
jgi:hypothetical protein